MNTKEKQTAVKELIKEQVNGQFSFGNFGNDGTITLYFQEERENWTNSFSGLLSQIGFNFTILSVNTLETGDMRYSITLIFNLENLEESHFW